MHKSWLKNYDDIVTVMIKVTILFDTGGEINLSTRAGLRTMTATTLHPFNSFFSRTTLVSQYQKGKTSLNLNVARDVGGFGMAVASAGPYANNLCLAPER